MILPVDGIGVGWEAVQRGKSHHGHTQYAQWRNGGVQNKVLRLQRVGDDEASSSCFGQNGVTWNSVARAVHTKKYLNITHLYMY